MILIDLPKVLLKVLVNKGLKVRGFKALYGFERVESINLKNLTTAPDGFKALYGFERVESPIFSAKTE